MTILNPDLNDLLITIDQLKFAKGGDGAKGAYELIDVAKTVLQMQHAAILADQHYLAGVSMRDQAKEQGVSANAVSLWIKNFGPEFYWTLRQEDGEVFAERVPPREARRLVQAGRRAIPATWGLGHLDELESPIEGYWHLLASQA